EIRVAFDGGELKDDGYWHIAYDGKEHSFSFTFWDNDKELEYKESYALFRNRYIYSLKLEGEECKSIKEKGKYFMQVSVGEVVEKNLYKVFLLYQIIFYFGRITAQTN
ncbi:MAG: hypothetical protein NC311_13475, partial [Muribaculaceae bacterium]|nr:hypothetical protein [Muribaculaceae bacterium]